jgi:NitT/TauT family transport system substrate-binding protein
MRYVRTIAAAIGLGLVLAQPAAAQAPEKKDVKLGVGGASLLYYLPLTLTERLGHFKDFGLNVEVNDFKGGSQSLQALVGGSADVVTGAYEHTIRMQQKGQDIQAVVELGRYPGIALGIRTAKAASYKSAADLKGMKIGVTAPGSSTNMVVWFMMAKAGLGKDDASFVGVGAGAAAVAAMQKGEIDAISNLDPVMAKLEKDGLIKVVAETRTTEGTTKVLGGPMPAAVLYVKRDFAQKNPNTMQGLVSAFYKTLKWMEKATPDQIADNVPPEYLLGDRAVYTASVAALREAYSRDGIVSLDGQKRSLEFLKQFEADFKDVKEDILAKTWDGQFVTKAAATAK